MNSKTKRKFKLFIWPLLALIILLATNAISSGIFYRFDLTNDNRFSLTETTKSLLEELQEDVKIQLFLGGNIPVEYKKLRLAATEMLEELDAYSNTSIQYEIVDPFALSSAKESAAFINQLKQVGLQIVTTESKSGASTTQTQLLPGAVIEYNGKKRVINFIENTVQFGTTDQALIDKAIAQLEFNYANALSKLVVTNHPAVVFSRGHGELSDILLNDFATSLEQEGYKVGTVNIATDLAIPPIVDVMIIAKPTISFNEFDKYKIDQFIMRGGKIIWLIDALNASLDSLMMGSAPMDNYVTNDYNLNLTDQLFQYGVRINNDLVQDEQCNVIPLRTASSGNFQPFPWYGFPVITPKSNHDITRQIGPILTNFTSSIDTIGKLPNIKKTILLHSSPKSKQLYNPVQLSLEMVNESTEQFTTKEIPIGVLLEGTFSSIFKTRPTGQYARLLKDSLQLDYLSESTPTSMVVIGDGDLIAGQYNAKTQRHELGHYRFNPNQPPFDNKAFLMNIVDYMGRPYNLLAARDKTFKSRPLHPEKIKTERKKWQIINLSVPTGIILLFGIVYTLRRRYLYSRS